tara:strand:- start:94118 stop:94771 length:654 start_codon:yes stop_codon:yes gene_type:complete
MNIIDSSSLDKTFAQNNSGLINLPLFKVKPVKYQIQKTEIENVIFQSRNSVNFFEDFDYLHGKRVFAMGEGTSLSLKKMGVSSIVANKNGSGGLIEFLKSNNYDANTLIVKGKNGLNIVRDELKRMGHKVIEAECYEREKLSSYTKLKLDYAVADAIVFTSCFSVQIYLEELHSSSSKAKLFGISKRICDYAKGFDLQIIEIDYFSEDLKEEIVRAI